MSDQSQQTVPRDDSRDEQYVVGVDYGTLSGRAVVVRVSDGAELGTRHLIELGHTDIVHLAGPQEWTEARARLRGWQDAMYAAGLRPSQHVTGDWSAASGFELGRGIAEREDVTAVFCANDQMALGLLRALSEAGRAVPTGPRGVSVVGFDDIPEAAYLIPPLTTVRQDFQAVGQRAIEILRAAIGQVPAPERLIGAELVVRASSAAPVERTP